MKELKLMIDLISTRPMLRVFVLFFLNCFSALAHKYVGFVLT